MCTEVEEPKVSVIIPMHNAQEYIKEAVKSVENQTLREIEIIIIDDQSIDNSSPIVEEIAKRDKRVLLLKTNKQIGAGLARNLGIKSAKGLYLAFLDADDFYPDKNSLANLYKTAIQTNSKICGGSLEIVDKNGKSVNRSVPFQYFTKNKQIRYKDYQFDGGFYRFIYERRFVLAKGLFFPNLLKFEDPIFFIKAMTKAGEFYAIKDYVYSYRKYHKIESWKQHEIEDQFRGISYALSLAKKENFKDLQYLLVKNILECLHFKSRSINLYKRLLWVMAFIAKINWKWIYLANKNNKVKLSKLKLIGRAFVGSKKNEPEKK